MNMDLLRHKAGRWTSARKVFTSRKCRVQLERDTMRPMQTLMLRLVRLLLLACAGSMLADPAMAQSTRGFGITTSAAINNATPCTTPIIQTFTVTSNFIVGDVDLGFFATHTWRGDIRVALRSPAGTRQQLVDGEIDLTSGDNLNVRLNDGGSQLVNSDDPLANHSAAATPPYQHNFIPNAPLSVFNGQTSAGTWVLEVCDIFPGVDDGTFIRSDLYLTPQTSSSGTGATFVVANTNDSGQRSLRQAIIDANSATAEADTIAFAIAGAGPHTIALSGPLPPMLGAGDTIDGTTQPGTSCGNLWAGTPPSLRVHLTSGATGTGLHLEAANLTVRGLAITGFTNKVYIHPFASNVIIQCNYIGLLPDGTRGVGTTNGVLIDGAGTVVGGLDAGEGNVISGNSVGVHTAIGSTNTAVRGNFIGTDPTGMSAIANGRGVTHLNGAGSWRDITRNLIAGNTQGEIRLDTGDTITPSNGQIRIQRNVLGYNRTQSAKLQAASLPAIFANTGSISNVLVGGDAATQGNVIGGAAGGIHFLGESKMRIKDNTIAGARGLGLLLSNVNGAAIGGSAAGLGNIIGANTVEGILARSGTTNLSILGNTIGFATIAGTTTGNGDVGIMLSNVSNVTIGDGTAGGRNVIGGNGSRAIGVNGTNSGITINGNYIGTDASGNVAVANGWSLSVSVRDAISFDTNGTFSNVAIRNNVIGGYEGALVEFWSGNGTGITVQGNKIGVGADGVSQIVTGNAEALIFTGGGGSFSNLLIGGSAPGEGNLVANSNVDGLTLDTTGTNIQVIGNTIRNNALGGIDIRNATRAAIVGNSILNNGGLAIDLGDNGVTANDAGDGDAGPNDLLNFPQGVSAWVISGNQLRYNFTLDAPAAANGYRIEFFANSAADASGFGEGERYLGHVDIAHAGGAQSYSGTITSLVPVAIGDIISATTTRRTAGGTSDTTSEFSAVVTAQGVALLTVATTSDVFDPSPGEPYATPGKDLLLTTTVRNDGSGRTDADSIFALVSINPANDFLNASTTALSGVVGFSSASAELTFNPANDLRFSNSAQPPVNFGQCTYVPAAGYDPQVRHVCLNPKGRLPAGAPQGEFTVRVRVRVR